MGGHLAPVDFVRRWSDLRGNGGYHGIRMFVGPTAQDEELELLRSKTGKVSCCQRLHVNVYPVNSILGFDKITYKQSCFFVLDGGLRISDEQHS